MADKWIAGAIRHPGALTAQAKKAGKTPMEFAHEKMHASGVTGDRARLALRLRAINRRRKKEK